jgi:isopentenyldiphosphate isomerase
MAASKDGKILSVVDGNDNVIGEATRKEIHEKGLLHREIHVWFVTPKGEIIFQHRAKDKDTYPDLLDATVGGHVEVGDSYEKTALKEMEEETGVKGDVKELHLLGKFQKRSEDDVTRTINNTIRAQYAYVYRGKVSDLLVEEGKALGFEAWPIDKLSNLNEEDRRKFIPLILGPDMLQLFWKAKKLISFDENRLINLVKPYLENCRDGDWAHAQRVAKWVKELGEIRSDLPLLITAAYVHDIGWFKVLPKGKLDLDEMLKFEDLANENSSKHVKEVLAKLNFTDSDSETVLRLVKAADAHEAKRKDEEIIVDADNLSKLCIEHLQQKYQPESYQKLIDLWENELASRIRTLKGRSVYPQLLKKLKEDVVVINKKA